MYAPIYSFIYFEEIESSQLDNSESLAQITKRPEVKLTELLKQNIKTDKSIYKDLKIQNPQIEPLP